MVNNIRGFRALAIAMMLLVCATISMAQTKSHTVTRGETIESVAQKYGVTVDALKEANPSMGSMFYVGMKLIIPEVKSGPTLIQTEPKQETSTVVPQTPMTIEKPAEQQPLPQQPAKSEETSEKDQIWHIDYYNSLKSGDKGCYGFGADNLGNDNGLGFSMRMYTNLFLVDSELFQLVTAFGANYHAKLGDIGYFVFPALLNVWAYNEISFDDKGKKDTKTKIGSGLLVSPYFAIGKKGGIAIGPTFSLSFVNGETAWGGYIGIWF